MIEQQVGFDLDLTKMADDALMVLAAECGFNFAEDELILRFEARKNRQIAVLATGMGLSREDLEDARQEGVLWIKEAIRSYDTNEIGKPGGCGFSTFVHQIVARRFLDFTKHLRREENHYDQSPAATDSLAADCENVEGTATGHPAAGATGPSDPEAAAQRHEFTAALNQALDELDDIARRILEMRLSGKSLHDVAEELGISYGVVRGQWRKMAALLKSRVARFA